MPVPVRRLLAALMAVASCLTAVSCTSSGDEDTAGSGAPSASDPARPGITGAPPRGPWSKQEAGQQLTLLLETQHRLATSVPVQPDSPFAEFHRAFVAIAQACDGLVAGLRGGHWPADVRSLVSAFTRLQAEECTVDRARAAATTAEALRAVGRLPRDHAEKVFDARLALETALEL